MKNVLMGLLFVMSLLPASGFAMNVFVDVTGEWIDLPTDHYTFGQGTAILIKEEASISKWITHKKTISKAASLIALNEAKDKCAKLGGAPSEQFELSRPVINNDYVVGKRLGEYYVDDYNQLKRHVVTAAEITKYVGLRCQIN